jgi:tetratricopeptide (TPR) repeat protein
MTSPRGYLGRVLGAAGTPVGTCFQVEPGLLVTAWHVLVAAGGAEVGSVVGVDGLGGAPAAPAEVLRVDAVHDLALVRRSAPLPASVGGLAGTDGVPLGADVVVTGHTVLPDVRTGRVQRFWDALGRWTGGAMREDAVALGRLSAQDVLRGMSGAPVRRVSDDVVVGVVSERYNSADGWGRDSVWVARTEDLAALLGGLSTVEVAGPPPLTGAAAVLLSVDSSTVRLHGAGLDVSAPHGGVRPGLLNALNDVRRARARAGTTRAEPAAASLAEPVSMRRAGELLAESFLPEPVAAALAGLLRRAEAASMPVLLGVDAADLSRLPWEAMPLAGVPLALHRLVSVYRAAAAPAPRSLPGPLRIVVAISAPAEGGGEVLDYERELRLVLAAVKGARAGAAQVRIVPFATTAAIRHALADGNVHVLHISAHGAPGALVLEDDDGKARTVTAAEFIAEAVPPGAMPPVLALAACYTAAPAAETATSFAADLVSSGAAAVIGTETSVTDRYATRLFSRVYTELASAPVPDVLAAVAQSRRVVQDQLATGTSPLDHLLSGLDEWATVTIQAAGPTLVLDPSALPAALAPEPATRSIAGLVARDPGDFVGRRVEQRDIPALLVDGSSPGVLLSGIGGVGKTTLAAEIIRRTLERQPSRVIASLTGESNVDAVLGAVAAALRRPLLVSGAAAGLQGLAVAERVDVPWQDRLAILREHCLDTVPLLLVLDNFEDNLTDPVDGVRKVRDTALAELLADLLTTPGRCRLLVTCRYPFDLPGDAAARLDQRPLGPLTLAETLKLIWSLPRLEQLETAQVEQTWRMVGGHPRTLEYVDALLAGGAGRFPDITARLATKVRDTLGTRATAWLATDRTLDAALADAVTVAADDVLLDDLLTEIATTPGATEVLLAASVYREAVDHNALLFGVGTADDAVGWVPDRTALEGRILAALAAHQLDADALNDALRADDLGRLPVDLVDAIGPDLAKLNRPPIPPRTASLDLAGIAGLLARASLLSLGPDDDKVFIHRWTASELERRWGPEALLDAHQRAAAYWRWRVEVWPQQEAADVHDLLEARHHLLSAGDIDEVSEVTEHACQRLHTWGAWDHEAALANDTLRLLPPDHPRRPVWLGALGVLASERGDPAGAQHRYRQALDLFERLGDRAGAAAAHSALGILARDSGDLAEAERRYHQALDIAEQLGDQGAAAGNYQRLGSLAHERGNLAEAERRYSQSLDIFERLGDQGNAASANQALGTLAQGRGDLAEAQRRYHQAVEIFERIGDQDRIVSGYHQLGSLAHDSGDLVEAERRYHQALDIAERLGSPASAANVYHNLGILARDSGDLAEAERRHHQALDIFERLGNQAHVAATYHELGVVAESRGDYVEAEHRYHQSIDIDKRVGGIAGTAYSHAGLGRVARTRNDMAGAIKATVWAWLIWRELGSPNAYGALRTLGELRAEVGTVAFVAAARAGAGEADVAALGAELDALADRPAD